MAKILAFPGAGVRAEIHTAIQLHAAGKMSRQKMMSFVAGRLGEYGLKRLSVNSYAVRVVDPVEPFWPWPVVIIEAKHVSGNPCCPVCGEIGCGYLAGDEIMTIMCLECGCIYNYRPGGTSTGKEAP